MSGQAFPTALFAFIVSSMLKLPYLSLDIPTYIPTDYSYIS
ncbi:hypothetical protein Krac_2688 [Ktedonobacter racemifer DSM 44963]|uniref:Uncharacterized protein n=1 Tax=Ktedonobacter racemifer DSM 44963 TaxID=485913 RepID=D6TZD8_KTERA|nr:hypothetical protein Krac_2688 [Ktedonobacter racemifer DSM 44963]